MLRNTHNGCNVATEYDTKGESVMATKEFGIDESITISQSKVFMTANTVCQEVRQKE